MGLGFEDPTSSEINLPSGLTPRNKVPWAHQYEGRSRVGAHSAAKSSPAQRLHHLRRAGEQGLLGPLGPDRAPAPLGCSLPPDPAVRLTSRQIPARQQPTLPSPRAQPAASACLTSTQSASLRSARATLKVFFNQRRPRLRGLTASAAPARPCLSSHRVCAAVSLRGRAPRGRVRRGTAGAYQYHQLSGSVARVRGRTSSPARRWPQQGLT